MIDNDEETIEEYTKRLAYNRYQMRMHFKFRLGDTAEDDWNYAREVAIREVYSRPTTPRPEENSDSNK